MWKVFLVHCILNNIFTVHANEDINLIIPENTDDTESTKFTSIANCIIAINNQELYFRPTVAILEQTGKGAENAFISELIKKLTEHSIPQLILKDVLNEENHDLHFSALTVAFLSKCDDVNNFNFEIIDTDIRFLLIISDPSNDNCVEKLEKIGKLVSRNAVTFIIQDFQTDKNKMFTIFPKIEANTCEEVVETPTHINTCFNGTITKEEIFPVKNPGNLNKCPFRVGMATNFPFATITKADSLKEYDRVEEIKGSDFEIMKIINEHFNATLDLHYISKNRNRHSRGFIDFMLNGSLDACAGGNYRVYGNIVEYSGIYVRQGWLWVYYAERPERTWQRLVSKLTDVYYFFIFYITYSFVWSVISLFDEDSASLTITLLRGWGAIVGATSLPFARSNKQRFLNLMNLIMCIYFYAYVSIQFYSFLTIRPPPHLLRTNQDVIESGMNLYLRNQSKFFMTDEKFAKFANTSKACLSHDDCADKAFKYHGLALVVQGNFYQIQAATAINDEARMLKVPENALTVYHEMIIRKDSSLVEKFQSVMQRLFEAGMTNRLFTEAIGITWVAKSTSANTNMMSSSYSCKVGCSITLKQFAGVFYAWIFGCVLSFSVFLIESFSKPEKRLAFVH